jgi:hypothetical protein
MFRFYEKAISRFSHHHAADILYKMCDRVCVENRMHLSNACPKTRKLHIKNFRAYRDALGEVLDKHFDYKTYSALSEAQQKHFTDELTDFLSKGVEKLPSTFLRYTVVETRGYHMIHTGIGFNRWVDDESHKEKLYSFSIPEQLTKQDEILKILQPSLAIKINTEMKKQLATEEIERGHKKSWCPSHKA